MIVGLFYREKGTWGQRNIPLMVFYKLIIFFSSSIIVSFLQSSSNELFRFPVDFDRTEISMSALIILQ